MKVYKALADETRLRILALLKDGEVCVCHIHGGLRMPQPTVSRHLAYLRRSGLVEARREGVWMHYRLKPVTSPIVREVVDAALHALAHAAVTEADRRRLQQEMASSRRRSAFGSQRSVSFQLPACELRTS